MLFRSLITGPTTGAVFLTLDEARVDLKPVDVVRKGQHVSFKVPDGKSLHGVKETP